MQIISYILTVCAAALLGINSNVEAKSHKHKEKSHHEKKSHKHDKKHRKDKEIIPDVVKTPEIIEEVTAPPSPESISVPVGKGHQPE